MFPPNSPCVGGGQIGRVGADGQGFVIDRMVAAPSRPYENVSVSPLGHRLTHLFPPIYPLRRDTPPRFPPIYPLRRDTPPRFSPIYPLRRDTTPRFFKICLLRRGATHVFCKICPLQQDATPTFLLDNCPEPRYTIGIESMTNPVRSPTYYKESKLCQSMKHPVVTSADWLL